MLREVLNYNEVGFVSFRPSIMFFVSCCGLGSTGPFLSIILQNLFLLSPQQIGILMSLIPLTSFISSPVISYMFDLSNKSKIFWVVLVFSQTSILQTTLLTESFLSLLVVICTWSALIGAETSLLNNTTFRYLGDRKQDFGKHRLWGALSYGIIAFLMGFMMSAYEYAPFVMNYFLYCSYAMMILISRHPPEKQSSVKVVSEEDSVGDIAADIQKEEVAIDDPMAADISDIACLIEKKVEESLKSILTDEPVVAKVEVTRMKELMRILLQPKVIVFYIIVFAFGLGMRVISGFLFLFLQNELDAPDSLLGIAIVFSIALEIVVFYFGEHFLRVIGIKWMIVIPLVLYIVRVSCYSILYHPWLVLPLELMHGVMFGCFYTAGTNLATTLYPDRLSATGQGIFLGLYFGAGASAGGLLGGILYDRLSPRIMFQVMAVIMFLSLALFGVTERAELFGKAKECFQNLKNITSKKKVAVTEESNTELSQV